MRKLRKAAKLLALLCLIALAGLGIGLSGGIPIPFSKNYRESEKEPTELVKEQEEKSDLDQILLMG